MTEKEKVEYIILNTFLNGIGHENYRITEDPMIPKYDYMQEAMLWAKSDYYFGDMPEENILNILRKYETWNEFEAYYGTT